MKSLSTKSNQWRPECTDINYIKLELAFSDVWRAKYTFKFKLKSAVDWIDDGDTSAVGEIEGGMYFARNWHTWLMLG